MVNLGLYNKFEVSIYTRYKDMKGGANWVVWGGYGSLKVIGNVSIRQSAYDFLFDFNTNSVFLL